MCVFLAWQLSKEKQKRVSQKKKMNQRTDEDKRYHRCKDALFSCFCRLYLYRNEEKKRRTLIIVSLCETLFLFLKTKEKKSF